MKKSAENSSNDKKSNDESRVRFQCSKCNDTFNDAIALIDHVSSAHESKSKNSSEKSNDYGPNVPILYPCNECKAFFAKEIQLKKHVKEEHAYATVEKCDQCNRSFYKSYLEKHKKLTHQQGEEQSENGIKCLVCVDEFATVEQLAEHLSNSHVNIFLGKRFLNKSNKCAICGKGFHSKYYLKNHINLQHGGTDNPQKITCDVCEKCFTTQTELTIHQKSTHERTFLNITSKLECKLCSKFFDYPSKLKTHNAFVHENRRDHECNSCEKKFTLQRDLQRHYVIVHEKSKNYKCSICEKSFPTLDYLQKHSKIRHQTSILKNDIFNCKLCNTHINSSNQTEVANHLIDEHRHIFLVKRPNDEKIQNTHDPNKCHYCEKSFAQKRNLREHIAGMHENRKDFKCNSCDKAFAGKRLLHQHIVRVHEKQTHHNNDNVNKVMADKVEEMAVGKSVKLYHCKLCNLKINSLDQSGVANHITSFHKNILLIKIPEDKQIQVNKVLDSVDDNIATDDLLMNKPPSENIKHRFECQICKKGFNKKYNLEIHTIRHEKSHSSVLEKRPENNKHQCSNCLNEFEDKKTLTDHRKETHAGKLNECDICAKVFSSFAGLQFHAESFHLGIKHQCHLCESKYTSKHHLIHHIRTFHERDIKNINDTKLGDKEFNPESIGSDLEEDITPKEDANKSDNPESMEEDTNVKCKQCDGTFDNKNYLRDHAINVHRKEGTDEKGYSRPIESNETILAPLGFFCCACMKDFESKIILEKHKKDTHKGKEMHCKKCDKSFVNYQSLEFHVKNIHFRMVHKCEICPETFAHSVSLSRHRRTAHEIKIYNKDEVGHHCYVCLKEFKSKKILKAHRKEAHVSEKMTCNECGKSFPDYFLLKRHVKSIHFGIKHQCHICKLKFTYKSTLAYHIKTIHKVKSEELEVPSNRKNDGFISTLTSKDITNAANELENPPDSEIVSINHKDEMKAKCDKNNFSEALKKRNIKCQQCEESFDNENSLKYHFINVHKDAISNDEVSSLDSDESIETPRHCNCCYICMEEFGSKLTLMKHKRETHNGKAKSCYKCGKSFMNYQNLEIHVKNIHFRTTQNCEICKANFIQSEILSKHRRSVHNVKTFNKSEASEITTAVSKNVEDIKHQCHLCTFNFSYKATLERHINASHNNKSDTNLEAKKGHKPQNNETYFSEHVAKVGKNDIVTKIEGNNSIKQEIGHHCYACMKEFKNKKDLKAHRREIHAGKAITCHECGLTFSGYFRLKSHVKGIHFGIKHQCHLCKLKFSYKTALAHHIKTTHKVGSKEKEILTNINNADNLEEVTSTKDNASNVNLFESLENTIAKCDKCDGTFDNENVLKEHISIDHKFVKKAKCDYCEEEFNEILALNQHLVSIHMGDKKFECTSCPAKFNVDSNLIKHFEIFHPENKFEESNSKECFENIDNQLKAKLIDYENRQIDQEQTKLNSNVEQTTSEIINLKDALDLKEENLTCQKCEQVFGDAYHLKCHKEIAHGHADEGKLICVICNKNFVNSSDLEIHIQKQLCEISNKIKAEKVKTEAKVKTEMELDLISKTGLQTSNKLTIKSEKDNIDQDFQELEPQTCGVCQLSFRSKSMLKLHYAEVHLQIKPHQCDTCDKQFGRYDYLRDHVKFYHEGQRDYRCHLCKKFFVYRGGLKWHLRERHQLWISRNEVLQNESVFTKS